MLCFSGSGMLSIKTGDFPLHQQKLQGFVVGFKGSKIFCLHYISMQTIDVPQSASLKRYLDLNNYEAAYKASRPCHPIAACGPLRRFGCFWEQPCFANGGESGALGCVPVLPTTVTNRWHQHTLIRFEHAEHRT